MKHECPSGNNVKISIKVTEGISLAELVFMPNMKSLSLKVQKIWPRLKFFFATDRHTDRAKTRCPFRGHKNRAIQDTSDENKCL